MGAKYFLAARKYAFSQQVRSDLGHILFNKRRLCRCRRRIEWWFRLRRQSLANRRNSEVVRIVGIERSVLY